MIWGQLKINKSYLKSISRLCYRLKSLKLSLRNKWEFYKKGKDLWITIALIHLIRTYQTSSLQYIFSLDPFLREWDWINKYSKNFFRIFISIIRKMRILGITSNTELECAFKQIFLSKNPKNFKIYATLKNLPFFFQH